MFYGITDLTTFVLGTIFIVLLPGPNSLYVMTVASKFGVRTGYQAAGGVFLGDIILMLLSATGAASVLSASPALFVVLKYLGAGYLSWIGFGLIRSALQHWSTHSSRAASVQSSSASSVSSTSTISSDDAPGRSRSAVYQHSSAAHPRHTSPKAVRSLTPFRTALGISLINPKSILFFVSFFVQFVDSAYPHPVLSFFILGVILQIISMIYLTVLILGGAHLAQAFTQKKHLSAWLTGVVGLIFIGFGLRLATASLT